MMQKCQLKGSENGISHLVFQISGLYSSSGILNRMFQKMDVF